jgi:hypothetical protein
MSLIFAKRYFLVFPDGLIQEVDSAPAACEGDLISLDEGETGPKYVVRHLLEAPTEDAAQTVFRYYLDPFDKL